MTPINRSLYLYARPGGIPGLRMLLQNLYLSMAPVSTPDEIRAAAEVPAHAYA